jgi:hypothetical protein
MLIILRLFFENELAEAYVALTFNNVNAPYEYSGSCRGKKFCIGGFDCITTSLSTVATQN